MYELDAVFELQRTQALERTGLLGPGGPPELQDACEQAKARFGVAAAMVTLVTAQRIVAKARVGTDLEEVPRRGQFCDYAIRADEVFVVPDAAADARFSRTAAEAEASVYRFYAGAPLVYFRRVRLGALCLLDPSPRGFSDAERAELARLAKEVASAIVIHQVDRKTAALVERRPVRAFG